MNLPASSLFFIRGGKKQKKKKIYIYIYLYLFPKEVVKVDYV